MKFTKSELTEASKEIAYANTKLIDAIGACEDLFRNNVFKYILEEHITEDENYKEILLEIAIRMKKYSKDSFAGDAEINAATLADATSVFKDIFNKVDEIE